MAIPQSPSRAVPTVVPTGTRCVCLPACLLPQEVFLTPEYLAIVMEFAQGGNVSYLPAGAAASCRHCQGL